MKFNVSFGLMSSCILSIDALGGRKEGFSCSFYDFRVRTAYAYTVFATQTVGKNMKKEAELIANFSQGL